MSRLCFEDVYVTFGYNLHINFDTFFSQFELAGSHFQAF